MIVVMLIGLLTILAKKHFFSKEEAEKRLNELKKEKNLF